MSTAESVYRVGLPERLEYAPSKFIVAAVPNPKFVLAVPASARSDRFDAFASFVPILFVTVVEKSASSPSAAASSFKVFSVPGAESTIPATSASTYAFTDCCEGAFVALFDDMSASSTNRVANEDAKVVSKDAVVGILLELPIKMLPSFRFGVAFVRPAPIILMLPLLLSPLTTFAIFCIRFPSPVGAEVS